MPTRMARIQSTDHTKFCQGCGATGNFIPCWWECKTGQLLWKVDWQFLTKLIIALPHDLAIVLLDIHPTDLKTYIQTKPT